MTGLTVAVLTTVALLGLTVYSASTAREMDSVQHPSAEDAIKRREAAVSPLDGEAERLRQAEMKALTAQVSRRD